MATYSYDREGNQDAFQVPKGKGSGDTFQANCQVERSPLNPDNVKGNLGVNTAEEKERRREDNARHKEAHK